MMLSAMPETTWLPRLVMQAKPWTMARTIENAMPAPSPSQAEPVTAAVAAAANAAPSILPSSADVDHARALGEQAGERGEHQRRREADGQVGEQQGLEEELVHQATAPAGAGRANSASS